MTGQATLPWLGRLPEARARNIAVRYFLGTFHIVNDWFGEGQSRALRSVEKRVEEDGVEALELLEDDERESRENGGRVMAAMGVLRVTGDRAK